MQINISIQLDPGELADLVRSFAGLIAPIAIEPPTTAQNVLPSPDIPAPTSTPVLAAIPPAEEAVHTIPPHKEETPPPAEEETEKPRRVSSSARLKFDEFDKLVRSEMKRLSVDGKHMPGHRLWEEDRDKRLPTLGAVLQRYDVSTLASLAEKLDMSPPLSMHTATNGAYREKETTL